MEVEQEDEAEDGGEEDFCPRWENYIHWARASRKFAVLKLRRWIVNFPAKPLYIYKKIHTTNFQE
ncbi:hypothetical protein M5K25_021843 [Dendrobium thyrsiflorum]|uniref:Uncharacterized protein n=1 Tax=Dendrobium thyrsiflorum TaxID=117978 RepID=A0ABD0UAS6_DENTH